MIVDTSVLLALFNVNEPQHQAVRSLMVGSGDSLVVSPYVLAELDYLVSVRHGIHAELAALEELVTGPWELPGFPRSDLAAARSVIERYSDQRIGLADASLVVLADRRGTNTIATLDLRHFSVLRPLKGGHFTLVP